MRTLRVMVALLLLLCLTGTAQAYFVNVSVKNMAAQPILNATVTLDSTQMTATLGYTNFTSIAAGTHNLLAEAYNYQSASFVIDLTSDLYLSAYLSNQTAGGRITVIQFYYGLYPAKNILTKVYYNESLTSSKYTGDDGRVAYWLESSKTYRINANISCNYSIVPGFDAYAFQMCDAAAYKWSNETVDTNLTNYTKNDTSGGNWSLQNLTGSYLENDLGISPLGQGILSSIVTWTVMGFNVVSGGVLGIGVLVMLALLGIVSWVIVLFCGMTLVAMYVLEGKIG